MWINRTYAHLHTEIQEFHKQLSWHINFSEILNAPSVVIHFSFIHQCYCELCIIMLPQLRDGRKSLKLVMPAHSELSTGILVNSFQFKAAEPWNPEFIRPPEIQTEPAWIESPAQEPLEHVDYSEPGAQIIATSLRFFTVVAKPHLLLEVKICDSRQDCGFYFVFYLILSDVIPQFCTVHTSRSCTMKSSCVESDALRKVGQEKLDPWYKSASNHRPNPPL